MTKQSLAIVAGTKAAQTIQASAISAVRKAVKNGDLRNLKEENVQCSDCDKRATQYDHRDYYRKLDVDPVCRGCNGRRGQGFPIILQKKKRIRPFEFSDLISDLVSCGWTQKKISVEVGCSQPNIARLLSVKKSEPGFKVGDKIVQLHKVVCG